MDKSFNVKNEPNPDYYTLESINLNMQRMELNVLKVFSNVSDRMNVMENKLDSILIYIARNGGNNFLDKIPVAANSAPSVEPQQQPPVTVAPPKPATTFAPNTTAAAPASTFKFSGSTTQNTPPFASPQPATSSLVGGTQPKSIFGPAANASDEKPLTFPSLGISNSTLDKKPVEANASPQPASTSLFGTQSKSIFGSPANASGGKPLTFSAFGSGNSFLDKKPADAGANHSFGTKQSSTFDAPPENAAEESENPEEYVPDAHYEPVVPLPDKVAVVTGEESEEVLFKNRCKLYIFNSETKEVKERGVGDIKILYDSAKKTHRVVMRREQVHKICANFRITKGMNVADKSGKSACGTFNCLDFSEDSQKGAQTIFIVRFREETIYEEFKKIFNGIAEESAQSGVASSTPVKETTPPQEIKKEVVPVKEGFGDKFAKKEDEWDCTECYTRNQAKDDSCVSCQSSKDGKKGANASFSFKPTTFASNATTGASTFKFGISSGTNQTFGTSPFASPQPASTSLFGGGISSGTQSKAIFGSPANASGGKPLTFSAFGSGNSFLDKKPADTDATHSFGAKQSSTFDAPPENAAEESENPEEYVPDAHYEPVVPLPDKVAVVTGEESEEALFKNRCKLYIFNSETKEVKERGVGDIKILYDSAKKTHRVVMRREQVHKICANFRITKGMNVADKSGTMTCGTFSCLDFSEDSQKGIQTVFIVRFREETVYEEFKKTFNGIAESNLQSGNPSTPVKETTPPQV